MYTKSIVATALILATAAPALAQEYVEYVSRDDRFTIEFPAQPKVTQTTFKSQYGYDLPARVYTADATGAAKGRYQVTVVDYNGIQAMGEERAKHCPPGAEPCFGNPSPVSSTGAGYWKADMSGATTYAIWLYLQKKPDVKFLGWATMDLVEGTLIDMVNADKSYTAAAVYMHENKLYVIEGTVPAGYPPPDWFNQNVGWLDEQGRPIRYQSVYHNGFPKPPVSTRGGAAQ
jgi:hypothetical protein